MNSRQRVLKTLNHQIPDRVPIDFGGCHAGIHKKTYLELINYLGIKDELKIFDPIQQLAAPCEELLQRFHADIRYIYPERFYEVDFQGSFIDEFGVTWKASGRPADYMNISCHPLADASISDIENYSFSDSNNENQFAGIREKALRISKNGSLALATGIGGSILETCTNLCGLEKWYIDTIENPAFCETLIDKLLEYWLGYYAQFLGQIGDLIDIVMIGDDLAGQNGPLISLDFYRKFLKTRHKKLIEKIKSLTEAKICYHTCGSCFDFVPDLIDIGVDVLNPVQTGLPNMEPQKIKDAESAYIKSRRC